MRWWWYTGIRYTGGYLAGGSVGVGGDDSVQCLHFSVERFNF